MAIKRASTTAAAGVVKKQRSVLKQCGEIEAACLGADNFPEKVRQMVGGNLTHCLGVPKEDRHPYQGKVIEMAGDLLTSVQAGFQKRIADADARLGSASAEKASREEAHAAAAAVVTTKAEAVAEAKVAAEESGQATKAAKAALSVTETAQVEGDKELVKALKKKTKIETVFNETYMRLKEGGLDTDVQFSAISAAIAFCQEVQFDESMLTSLPSALAKEPADRGTFDAMVWQQLEDEFTKRIQGLQETIASGEPAKAERASKVDAAIGAVESAIKHAASCKASHDESKAELAKAKADHKDAASAVSQFGHEMKQVEQDLASVRSDLASFTDGALASYEELLKYTKELPVPDAESAAAAEAAASTQ